jgi:hypothetical protein
MVLILGPGRQISGGLIGTPPGSKELDARRGARYFAWIELVRPTSRSLQVGRCETLSVNLLKPVRFGRRDRPAPLVGRASGTDRGNGKHNCARDVAGRADPVLSGALVQPRRCLSSSCDRAYERPRSRVSIQPISARHAPADIITRSIVFVHGLGGSSIGTWTSDETGKTWISDPDFLGTLKDRARVMTFGYNANLFQNVTTSRVVEHANDLLEKLVVRRRKCKVG